MIRLAKHPSFSATRPSPTSHTCPTLYHLPQSPQGATRSLPALLVPTPPHLHLKQLVSCLHSAADYFFPLKPLFLFVPILSFLEGLQSRSLVSTDRWPSHGHESLLTFPPPLPPPTVSEKILNIPRGIFRGPLDSHTDLKHSKWPSLPT